MATTPKVLVVGGGPAGLVLAISLSKNGIPVRIIEKNPHPRVGQRGAGIMPRSLELFAGIGIIDKVLQDAITVRRMRKYNADGTQPIEEYDLQPTQDPTPSNPYLNPLFLGQDKMEKIFHAALAELGCTIELGTEFKSFTQFDDHVEVKLLVRGSDPDAEGVEETASFEYLVGTDGAKGAVRKQLGLTFLGETRKVENFVVGDARVDGLSSEYWHMWGDISTTMLGLRGTDEPDLFSFILTGKHVNHTELAKDPDQLRKVFIERTGNRQDLKFRDFPWISAYTPSIRMVDKFGVGRVFVAGDSAHVHSPTGGQGMNSSVQDSYNLAWKLALVIKNFAPPCLLDTYTEERLPVIAEMLNQTTQILKSTFKNGTFRPFERGRGLLQLGINYRWSSIVLDERQILERRHKAGGCDSSLDDNEHLPDQGENDVAVDSYGKHVDGHLRAGDRAPDACGLVGRSAPSTPHILFQIFGCHYHTVIIFSALADPKPVLQLLKDYPHGTVRSVVVTPRGQSIPDEEVISANMVLEDKDGHAHGAYIHEKKISGVVVVRPDGVVGAIVEDQRWVHKYFLGVFAGETRESKSGSSTPPSC